MNRTQRNKATMGHLGMLKARLAKLRRELISPKGGGGGPTEAGFDVAKTGDARIGFVGEWNFFSCLGSTRRASRGVAYFYPFVFLFCAIDYILLSLPA
jgi:ribosome-interacting GTPase 1